MMLSAIRLLPNSDSHSGTSICVQKIVDLRSEYLCETRFLEPPDRSTESHWRAAVRASDAGLRAIASNTTVFVNSKVSRSLT